MSAKKGNGLWKRRKRNGRNLIYETPGALWAQAMKYFNWCEENPTTFQAINGKWITRPRPYTKEGLAYYLGVSTLRHYASRIEFETVMADINNIIYEQKFNGAAIGMFHHSLIAKDLGLKDKIQITATPVQDAGTAWVLTKGAAKYMLDEKFWQGDSVEMVEDVSEILGIVNDEKPIGNSEQLKIKG